MPAATKVLPFCPLTASVLPRRTYRPPEVCATHSCQTEACFSSPPYRSTSFLSRYKCFLSPLSRHAPNGSPSNLPFLGGLSSQQDVPPKRAWAGAANRSFPLSPPPNHTPLYLLPLTSSPWPHHVLYWLGTDWWCLSLTRDSFLDMSKSLPAAHVSAVIWRLSVCVSWPFMWVFLWFFAPFRSWASYDNELYISLAHF